MTKSDVAPGSRRPRPRRKGWERFVKAMRVIADIIYLVRWRR